MSDETTTIDANDPLSADVGDKDTIKYPILAGDKTLRFEIRKPSTVPSAETKDLPVDKQQRMLVLPCYTTQDWQFADGRTANKGFPVFVRLFVSINEFTTAQDIANTVTPWGVAAGLKGIKVRDVIEDPVKYFDGKLVDCAISIKPAGKSKKSGKEFKESNELKPIPPA